ncbi:predicted protein [Brucella sp. 83/13]|nr:predicted protein [Brucella sp. 83/13]
MGIPPCTDAGRERPHRLSSSAHKATNLCRRPEAFSSSVLQEREVGVSVDRF